MRIYNYKIPVSNGLLVDAYAKHMLSIYSGDTVAHPTLYKPVGICLAYAEHMLSIHLLVLYKVGYATVSPEYMLSICIH